MTSKPKLLDLFSCAGGAAMGYSRAGFDVYCVDIDPQPNNPFPFHQGDAVGFLKSHIRKPGAVSSFTSPENIGWLLNLRHFDAIHASPPCQGYTAMNHGNHANWPKLIEPVRDLLEMTGLPYVIENVQGAPIRRDLTLCGEMFGLGVIRHRYFELGGWTAIHPPHVKHRGRVAGWRHGTYYDGPYVAPYGNGGGKGSVEQWQQGLGIDWTTDRRELAEALPPAYTEFIGRQLMTQLERTREPVGGTA